jgi:AraC-like DNA-binding protein
MMINTRQLPDGLEPREELAQRIARALPHDGTVNPQPNLHLFRKSVPSLPHHGVSQPAFCVIAQGAKEVLLGDDLFRYDADNYFLSSVGLPGTSTVIDPSVERPYLAFRLDLEPALVASVVVESGVFGKSENSAVRALDVSPLDDELRHAVLRLLRLLENPADYRVLAPLIVREIVYRLLKGNQGERLRQMTSVGGQTQRIARAIERLREDFDKPLRIETIAKEVAMSVSAFHHHFKAVTAMSPLQFQKQLRLQEARRLMLAESLDAATAGFQVGYEDASHFNREYKRLFGEPPIRDIERVRDTVSALPAVS